MRPDRYVCTSDEARRLDGITQARYGLAGERLMDAAGVGAALIIRNHHPDPVPVLVLAGPGHNGGDGWVVARVMSQCGYPTTVHAIGGVHTWQKEAVTALGDGIRKSESISDWPTSGIIVDALFGIGLNRPVEDGMEALIRHVNGLKRAIWSLDTPTGLDATNGTILGASVHATHTVAMGCWKSGYWAGDGPRHCGHLHLVPIGFPSIELSRTGTSVFFADDRMRVEPAAGAHKYGKGTVHIVGGSAGMSGAVVMAAQAAWDAGCGSVMVHVPGAALASADTHLVHPVKFGYGAAGQSRFDESHAPEVLAWLNAKPGVVVIGPGSGRHPDTLRFIRILLDGIRQPVVIDADALAAIDGMRLEQAVLTPHAGELAKSTGIGTENWEDRRRAAIGLASDSGALVVSKGQPTAIIQPDGRTRIAGYDTRVFSRMGSGDTLAGAIGSFLLFGGPTPDSIESALLHGIRHARTYPTATE